MLTKEQFEYFVKNDPVRAIRLMTCGDESADVDYDPEVSVKQVVEYAESCDNRYRPSQPFFGYTASVVEAVGGGEGGGEYVERIIGIRKKDAACDSHESFVKMTGCYYSNDGIYWDEGDGITRVYPREVMVIQYFDTP